MQCPWRHTEIMFQVIVFQFFFRTRQHGEVGVCEGKQVCGVYLALIFSAGIQYCIVFICGVFFPTRYIATQKLFSEGAEQKIFKEETVDAFPLTTFLLDLIFRK